eukprot:c33283_g1_i1 orf=642-2297(-)
MAAFPSSTCFDTVSCIFTSPRRPLSVPPDLQLLPFIFSNTLKTAFHHRIALADTCTAQSLTFLQLRRHIRSVAGALSFLGIKQHDVVLIVSPNSIQFPVVFLAIISLGAIATLANPLNTPNDIFKQATHSHAKLIITVPKVSRTLHHSTLPILLIDSAPSPASPIAYPQSLKLLSEVLKQSAQHTPPSIHIQQTDPAALLYTSGTTGASKAAIISHKNFIAAALQVKLADDTCNVGTGNRTFLCCVPMFHAFGLSVISMAQLHMGNTIITMPKYNIHDMLDAIYTYRVTHLPVVPPIMVALAKHDALRNYDLSSVIEVVCGAGRVNDETMAEVSRRIPSAVIRLDYGMTETSGRIAVTTCDEPTERNASSVGPLVSGMEAIVVDPSSNKRLSLNEQGELWVRGPNIIQGYLYSQEATAATIDKDGWLHTGDLVYIDNEGDLHVVGRLKELIKYKGLQVAPMELEMLLMTHPQIIDAAVVPFPHECAGEIPLACVIRAPGSSLEELDVIQFVEAQVAPYKKIRMVKFVEELPKTASGKVTRHKLMQQAMSKL